jgi:hypothetical protein
MQQAVRRAMALTTLYVAMVCAPAGPAAAELGDPDPGGGNATTSTTVDSPPTTEPSPDSTTTTTTTVSDPSTTTTTVPADDDADTPTTSTSTPTTGPGPSTTSTSIPSSGGTGRSTTTSRPSSTTTTAPGSTVTTAPAFSPTGAVATNDTAGGASPVGDGDGDGDGSGGSSSSGRSGRTTHPSPTRPERDAETTADTPPDPLSFPGDPPVPPGFDPAGLGGLFGLGAVADEVPAGVTSDPAPTDLESALPSRDQGTSSSVALLGLSLLILLALAGGIAYRWWDRRPERYWPA